MPFQPTDYASIAPQGNPWMKNLVDNLTQGYQAGQLPSQMARQAQKEKIANALSQLQLQQEPQKFNSDMMNDQFTRALQGANTNNINTMTPLDAEKQSLANKMYNRLTESQINENNANAYLRNQGGPRGGVWQAAENDFKTAVQKDNPNLREDQLYEATNVLRSGGNKLSDGTELNALSENARSALDVANRSRTTPQILNQANAGQKASAELPVLSSYIQSAQLPYSSSVLGISPAYLSDSGSKDKSSQERLARYDASKVLQADQAAIQNRLNSGQSTASITKELLGRYPGGIKSFMGIRTQDYTKEFTRYLNEALEKGFEARQSVPIGASTVSNVPKSSGAKQRVFNLASGEFE